MEPKVNLGHLTYLETHDASYIVGIFFPDFQELYESEGNENVINVLIETTLQCPSNCNHAIRFTFEKISC